MERSTKSVLNTIVISGCSSIGKTTLAKILLEKYSQLSIVNSYTTRKKRQEDINYIHIPLEEFKKSLDNKEFADYSEVYTNTFYGTKWDSLYEIKNNGKIPLLVTNIDGAMNYNNITNCLVIYLIPKNIEVIKERIRKVRSEKVEERIKSLDRDIVEYFDHTFKINYFEEVIDEIFELIENKIKNAF